MPDVDDLRGAKVLIVDDVPANLDLLRGMLQPLEFQIFFATSGEMAQRVAAQSEPDLILLDVMLPDIDGFETCRQLKQEPTLADIPVIFITAKTDVEDLARGFEVGGVDYITKPIKQPEVHARATTHLRIRSLIQQQERHLAELEEARNELQELNATKDRFLTVLAKDLREPLAAIREAGQLLRDSMPSPGSDQSDQAALLNQVNESTEHVLRLVEDVLEWPRVQLGQKLDLLQRPVTDEDLGYLIEALDNLRFLSVAETQVTARGLEQIRRLTHLQELHLDFTAIDNDSLALLADLQNLQVLDLKGTPISDDGLLHLQRLPSLRALYLTRTAITDAGLAHLSGLPNLQLLILWDTRVTDGGLAYLKSLQSLRELILWNTQVTEQGVADLQKALPDCEVSISMDF